jgi:hypothetical protein
MPDKQNTQISRKEMATMANTRMLALTRLRYDSALHGHAMSFGGMKLTIERVICTKLTISGPVFATNGISVPISRGSPPFYDE